MAFLRKLHLTIPGTFTPFTFLFSPLLWSSKVSNLTSAKVDRYFVLNFVENHSIKRRFG